MKRNGIASEGEKRKGHESYICPNKVQVPKKTSASEGKENVKQILKRPDPRVSFWKWRHGQPAQAAVGRSLPRTGRGGGEKIWGGLYAVETSRMLTTG